MATNNADFKVKKGLIVTEDIELGHASDTTIARASAGQITVEGTAVVLAGGANHDGFSDFVANEHIDHSGVTITAGTGMTGGGTIAATRTLNVIGGDGITANANDVAITAAQTTITSVLNTGLVIGRDSTDQIKFGTDNQIIFRVGNADGVTFKASGEIEATKFDGALEGNADTASVASRVVVVPNNALGSFVNENNLILFSPDGASSNDGGNLTPESSTAFHYNPSSTVLTVPKITGDVTGDITGTATNATAITLGGHLINDVDIGTEFVDTDDHIMSSGAIKEYVDANGGGATNLDGLSDAKSAGTNFTGSLLIGHQNHGTLSSAVYNTGVGLTALDALTTADNTTALGYGAGTAVTTGGNSVFVGTNAGNTITTNERITSIGTSAGKNSGFGEVSIGFWAGIWNLGLNNVNIGYAAGARGAAGANDNISIGNMAGGYSGDGTFEGHYNIFLGHQSGHMINGATNYNIGIGRDTLRTLDDGSEHNIAIGHNAGTAVTTGDDNILIGNSAGDNITTGSDNVIIGGIDASAADVNDSLIVASGDGGVTWIEGNSDGVVLGALTPLFFERQSLNTSAVDFRVPVTGSSTANPNGYPMPFAGKVVAASFLFTGTIADDTNTNTIQIRKNGGSSGSDIKEFTFTGGDLLHPSGNTLVKSGSDVLLTFAVGDIIQIKRQGGSTNLQNAQAMLWVSFNF